MKSNVLDILHESLQRWDLEGRLVYCNEKSSDLFGMDQKEIDTLESLMGHWSFYSSDGTHLAFEELPPHICYQTKKPQLEYIMKMVRNEDVKWVVFSAIPDLDEQGNLAGIMTTLLDITHFKSEEQKYKNIANYDPLTKLPNRSLLADRLELAISHVDRHKKTLAVCLIDLDGFKEVNDTHGHEIGDKVLIEAAHRMQKVVRSDDTVARLGGDEFVIILTDLAKSEECAVSLYRILNTLAEPYIIDNKQISCVSASIGVSLYPDDKVEADTLLRHADVAMYKSKNSGKNKFSFFDITSDQKIKANYRTINKLKNALESDQFCFFYQPKVHAGSGEVIEVEALARWKHPLLGIVSPAEFLPLVENDEELCERFDEWVITESIKQLIEWQKIGLYLKICINISPRQFKHKHFVKWLKDIIKETKVPTELLTYLEFEILETAAVESLSRSNEVIRECNEMGITFALDDFGTGYSSLMHLKELKVDTIKVDRLFVSGMLEQTANMVIVQAVVALANAFDISVTAEGAEGIEHVVSLLEMGCDAIQGYAISRPMPAEDIPEFIKKFTPDPRWKMASHILPSKADFELLLATSNLKYWVDNVIEGLSKDEINTNQLRLDHKESRFGKWYENAKKKKYNQTKSFAEVGRVHEYMHQRVKKIVESLIAEHRPLRSTEKEQIMSLRQKIMDLLEDVRKEIEYKKQQNNLINKILQKRNQVGK